MALFSKNKENDTGFYGKSSSIFDEQVFGDNNAATTIEQNVEYKNLDDNNTKSEDLITESNTVNSILDNQENNNQDNNIVKDDNNITTTTNNQTNNNETSNNVYVKYIVEDDDLMQEKKLEELVNKITNNNINVVEQYLKDNNEYLNTNRTIIDQNYTNENNNLQDLLELKLKEYKTKYPTHIEEVIRILKEKKYNNLPNDIKYLLIRYLAEDADIYFQENYNSKTDEEKLAILNKIISDYKKYIKYENITLDELDYYYITPFILFLNRENSNSKNRKKYILEMEEMIDNRIKKQNVDDEIETIAGEVNDLDKISRKIALYQQAYPDIFKNFKKSFSNEEFQIMSLGQKSILLRILTESQINKYYQELDNDYERQKFIRDIAELYEVESKENNFSYDWFFSGVLKFEDYLQIRKYVSEYEKQYPALVKDIIGAITKEKYDNMYMLNKYALLKYLLEPVIKNSMKNIDNENMALFINNIYDNFLYIFDKNMTLKSFNILYKNMQEHLYNSYQELLTQQQLNNDNLNKNLAYTNSVLDKKNQMLDKLNITFQKSDNNKAEADHNSIDNKNIQQISVQQQMPQQQMSQQAMLQQQMQKQQMMQQQQMQQQQMPQQQMMQQQMMQQQPISQQQMPQQAVQTHLNAQQMIEQKIKQQQDLQQQQIMQQQMLQKQMMQQAMQQQMMQQQMQQQMLQQQMLNNNIFNNEQIKEDKLVLAGDNVDGDTIIYFAGYKDPEGKILSLYKMKKAKFDENRDKFIQRYKILSYKNNDGKVIPIIITEEHYNDVCDGSKEKCLSMMKETLFELKTSKISSKIKAFRNITTNK